jgi:hypothetical protein
MTYLDERPSRPAEERATAFRAGPRVGDPMPSFDLPTTDGGRIRKDDFVGFRPLVLAMGSATSPMTAAAAPMLRRLYDEIGDRVELAFVYVREAQPDDRWPQPRSFDRKLRHARALKLRDRLLFPVAVDDVEGSFHRALDPKPSSVYVMDADGLVVFRSTFATDESALRAAIDEAASRSRATFELPRPMPPLSALTRIANLWRPLPIIAAAAGAVSVVALFLALGLGLRRAH